MRESFRPGRCVSSTQVSVRGWARYRVRRRMGREGQDEAVRAGMWGRNCPGDLPADLHALPRSPGP